MRNRRQPSGMFIYIFLLLISLIRGVLPIYTILDFLISSGILFFVVIFIYYVLSEIFPFVFGAIGLLLWVIGLPISILYYKMWYTIVYIIFFAIQVVIFISTLRGDREKNSII